MIYDSLDNIKRYKGISTNLDVAIEFLEKNDIRKLKNGKIEILEDKVFANVMEVVPKEESEVDFEIHKKYIDIQIDVIGSEFLFLGNNIVANVLDYNENTDYGAVHCDDSMCCKLGDNKFVMCFPGEPHKPSIKSDDNGYLKKCVIKVVI